MYSILLITGDEPSRVDPNKQGRFFLEKQLHIMDLQPFILFIINYAFYEEST